jgi:N-acetyl-alpha-D-glucosaminyl L-malate synthase BshA
MLAKKHEVHLVSYDKPVRAHDEDGCVFHRVELLSYPLFERVPCCYSLALVSKLAEIITSYNLDIVHAHYAVPNAASAYLAKKICNDTAKLVTTLHGTDSYLVGRHPSYKAVTQFSIQHSDALTAVSEYLKDRTLTEFDISRELVVIPNFTDPQRFRRLEKKDEQKIISHSSNFRAIKRIPDIIQVFKILSEKVDCKLTLIGNGPEQPKAKSMVKNLGLSKRVEFLGNVKNVQEILGKSDLFLLPSEDESFGLAALEAMSCEIPVVASNVGGLRELISHGADGYLVDVGDVEALATYSLSILQNPKQQEKFGRNARRKVLRMYTPDKIMPQYERLYEECLTQARLT